MTRASQVQRFVLIAQRQNVPDGTVVRFTHTVFARNLESAQARVRDRYRDLWPVHITVKTRRPTDARE